MLFNAYIENMFFYEYVNIYIFDGFYRCSSLSHTQSYSMLKGDANSDFSFHDLRKIHHYLKSWYSKFNYNSLNFACCIGCWVSYDISILMEKDIYIEKKYLKNLIWITFFLKQSRSWVLRYELDMKSKN